MPPEEADPGRLFHIFDAATKVKRIVAGKTYDDYLRDEVIQLAVERLVGIIGEAANKLSVSFRQTQAQIPWADIIRTRHIMVHDYDRIIHATVWKIVTVHIPVLIEQLGPLLPPTPTDPIPGDRP